MHMKVNQQLVQINRNFVICFVISALSSALIAQTLGAIENHFNATITIVGGYAIYFAVFSALFYTDNKDRYKQTSRLLIKKEILKIISSFGIGEIVYLAIRWPTFYYFLETDIEPFFASISSEVIATAFYMASVTVFLRKTRTF